MTNDIGAYSKRCVRSFLGYLRTQSLASYIMQSVRLGSFVLCILSNSCLWYPSTTFPRDIIYEPKYCVRRMRYPRNERMTTWNMGRCHLSQRKTSFIDLKISICSKLILVLNRRLMFILYDLYDTFYIKLYFILQYNFTVNN